MQDHNIARTKERRISRKQVLAATVFLMVMAVGGAAFAYWTSSGAGAGNADTGTSVAVAVNQTSTVSDLAPGSGTQALSGTFDNANDGPVFVTAVSATVSEVNDAQGAPLGGSSETASETMVGAGGLEVSAVV